LIHAAVFLAILIFLGGTKRREDATFITPSNFFPVLLDMKMRLEKRKEIRIIS
jgi:hypothetical protein